MTMRKMPDPGEEDMSGNPLKEGILADGGWQNRQKRDESFAKVGESLNMTPYPALFHESETEHDIEIPAELVDVLDSEEAEKKQKELHKEADLLKDVGQGIGDAAGAVGNAVDDAAGFVGDNAVPIGLGVATGLVAPELLPAEVGAEAAGVGAGEALSSGGVSGLLNGAVNAGKGLITKIPGVGGGAAAEEAGAGAAGAGSKALDYGKRYLQWEGLHDILHGGQGGGGYGVGGGGGGVGQPTAPIRDPGYYARTAEVGDSSSSPSSQEHIPSNDTDDPEQVDYKEHNDGNTGPYGTPLDVNDVGGTIDSHGAGAERLRMLMPLVMHYNHSEESGAEDPLIQGLIKSLQMEDPNVLNHPPDAHGAVQVIKVLHGPGQSETQQPTVKDMESEDKSEDDGDVGEEQVDTDSNSEEKTEDEQKKTGATPGGWPNGSPGGWPNGPPGGLEQQMVAPAEPLLDNTLTEVTCPECGSLLRGGRCPKCGYVHQEQYVDPFVDQPVQHRQGNDNTQGPHSDEQKAAVAQLLIAEGREDEVPQMLIQPWEYADELAKVQNANDTPPDGDLSQQPPEPAQEDAPPGQTMPVPGMDVGQQMMGALRRHAEDKGLNHQDPNHIAIPPALQEAPEDSRQEQDSGHTWMDQDGNPLKVNQEYEMHSERYDVPDYIKITAIKPDSIEFELTGEYGLDHRTELKHQEANIEGVTFSPAPGVNNGEIGPDDLNENMDDTARPAPGEMTDLSDIDQPHMTMARRATEHNDPRLDWLRVGGARYTPLEQRDFIDEDGVARNADKLDLTNTHYEANIEYTINDHFLF